MQPEVKQLIDETLQEFLTESKFQIYNKTLNPALWGTEKHLDPVIRVTLLKIANDFYKKTKFAAPIEDIWIMGSIANFNWTPDSDIDVHVLINFAKLKMPPETAVKITKTVGAQWNNEHKVSVKGFKVELNIQSVHAEKPYVMGIYSLVKDEWIRQPSHLDVHLDKALIQDTYHKMRKYFELIMQTGDVEKMKGAKDYLDDYRQSGLTNGGELSVENIVYKILRAKGILKKLKDAITTTYDKSVTVVESDGEDAIEKTLSPQRTDYNTKHFSLKFNQSKNKNGIVYFGDIWFANIYFDLMSNRGWVINRHTGAFDMGLPALSVWFKTPQEAVDYLEKWYEDKGEVKEEKLSPLGLPISGEEKYSKQEPGGQMMASNLDEEGTYHDNLSDDEKYDNAVNYFSIGQDEDTVNTSTCWVLDGTTLRSKVGGTHSMNFGYNFKEGKFSGWYDPHNNAISIVFPEYELRKLSGRRPTVDDIPQTLYKRLMSKFGNNNKMVVFENVNEVVKKDINSVHPHPAMPMDANGVPILKKMTLSNLKAIEDKIRREPMTGELGEDYYNKRMELFLMIHNEIKRRLNYINEPVTELKKFSLSHKDVPGAAGFRGPHTPNEADLLITGKKPAASISTWEDLEKLEPYVKSGKILHKVCVGKKKFKGFKYNVFALPGEEWRMNKICAMFSNLSDETNMNMFHAKMGILFGYDKEDIRKFIALENVGKKQTLPWHVDYKKLPVKEFESEPFFISPNGNFYTAGESHGDFAKKYLHPELDYNEARQAAINDGWVRLRTHPSMGVLEAEFSKLSSVQKKIMNDFAAIQGLKLASPKDMLGESLFHSFEADYGRGKMYVEIFKNPSPRELKECKPHYEIGALLSDQDIYVWNREKAYHRHVMTQLKMENLLPVILIPDNNNMKRMDVSVTDASRGTKWEHNPNVAAFIRDHPFFRGKQIDSISYWDEDVVGDWAEITTPINESSDSTYDATVDFMERRDQQLCDLATLLKNSKGQGKVPWKTISATLLKKTWLLFGKYNKVNINAIDKIADQILTNIARLDASTTMMGHTRYDGRQEAEDNCGITFTEEEWDEWMSNYFTDKHGGYMLSDYGLEPLKHVYVDIFNAETPEAKLYACDKALNIVHQRSDLASMFVEGGRSTLEHVANQGGFNAGYEYGQVNREMRDKVNEISERVALKNTQAILPSNPPELIFTNNNEHAHVDIFHRIYGDEMDAMMTQLQNAGYGDSDDETCQYPAANKLAEKYGVARVIIEHDGILYVNTPNNIELTNGQLRTLKNFCIENNLRLVHSIGIKKREIELNEGFGAGRPEDDRLHIPGERWRIKWDSAPKTPMMKEAMADKKNLYIGVISNDFEIKAIRADTVPDYEDEHQYFVDRDGWKDIRCSWRYRRDLNTVYFWEHMPDDDYKGVFEDWLKKKVGMTNPKYIVVDPKDTDSWMRTNSATRQSHGLDESIVESIMKSKFVPSESGKSIKDVLPALIKISKQGDLASQIGDYLISQGWTERDWLHQSIRYLNHVSSAFVNNIANYLRDKERGIPTGTNFGNVAGDFERALKARKKYDLDENVNKTMSEMLDDFFKKYE